jgi:hypothetical protein
MATTRSTGKISPKGVRQTRKYSLKFLQAPHVPPVARPGQRRKTFEYPEWLIMLIGCWPSSVRSKPIWAFTG